MQKHTISSLIATSKGLDSLEGLSQRADIPDDAKSIISDVSTYLADSMSILAHGSHLLDKQRRLLYKGQFKDEYSKSLCCDNYPIANELFGSDISEKIKGVTESLKVTQKLEKRSRKFTPYVQKRRFPFLGKGRPRDHRDRNQSSGNWRKYKNIQKTHRKGNQ